MVRQSAARYAAEVSGLSASTPGERRFAPENASTVSGHAGRPITNGFAGCERVDAEAELLRLTVLPASRC